MSIKTIAKKILNTVLSDYEIYKIYQWNTSDMPFEVGTGDFRWAELRADRTLAALTPAVQQHAEEVPDGSCNQSLHTESLCHAALQQDALVLKNQAYFANDTEQNTAENAEEGARVFVCLQQGSVVAICIYWYGARYLKRNFITLQAQQAKLVHIETLPTMRGKGIASQLIRYSSAMMATSGFTRLYARIWHSNTPSINSFTNAGWQYLTTIVTARSPLWGALKVQFKPFNIKRL